MLIFADNITPRLEYISRILLRTDTLAFTSSSTRFHEFTGPKINYSNKRFASSDFLVRPTGLLSQTGIRQQDIRCADWLGSPIFFRTSGDLPFDIFSAAFYLLSRYEEYLPHNKDSHGRFSHENSLAFKENFLHLPIINIWLQHFFSELSRRFNDFQAPRSSFRFIPTYDIDIAYAYRGKSILRKLLAHVRGGKSPGGRDVFDVYAWLDQIHKTRRLTPVYFFLLAHRRNKYDKNLSPRSSALQQLVCETAAKHTTGLHPSAEAYHSHDALLREIKTLNRVTGKQTQVSRQHYILFTLPHTYRKLMDAGIKEDYSMGYGSINGFRASYCLPFLWYDLMKDETSSLLVRPFCYMDANAIFEQKSSPAEARKELQHFRKVVEAVNGELITIFHNHFLTEQPEWRPWRDLYKDFLTTFPSPQE